MKRKLFQIGIISLVLMFGMILMGCPPVIDGPKTFTVTFIPNGGNEVAPKTVEDGGTITLPANPTRGGYTFVGWFTDQEQTIPFDSSQPITKDMILYAKWTANGTANILTVEAVSAGVKLTVMIDDIPEETTNIQFRLSDQSSAYINLNSWEWEESHGKFFEKEAIEIIYPFISPNANYSFDAEFSGGGDLTVAVASITATAGLGKMTVGDPGEYTLSYDEGKKTISFNKIPQAPSLNDTLITSKKWEWKFWEGHNWNDTNWWNASMTSEDPVGSVIIDSTFREKFNYHGEELRGKAVFVTTAYIVVYNGIEFIYTMDLSDSFNFPEIEVANNPISRFNALLAAIPNVAGEHTINLTEDVLDHPGFSINRTTPGIKVILNGNGKTISWKYTDENPNSLLHMKGVELVLQNITLVRAEGNTKDWALVGIGNGGTFEMEDEVTLDNSNVKTDVVTLFEDGVSSFTMSGGVIKNGRVGIASHRAENEIIISGGTITDCDEGLWLGKGSLTISDNGKIENCDRGIASAEGTITMSGGTIQNCRRGIDAEEGTITMTGGTISDCEEQGIAIWNGGSVTMSDGIIQNVDSGIVTGDGTITIEEGTISEAANVAVGVWGDGSVTMSGGTIQDSRQGLVTDYGTINMNGGTITDIEEFAIGLMRGGSLTMTSGTITGNATGILVNASQGTKLDISGVTIEENDSTDIYRSIEVSAANGYAFVQEDIGTSDEISLETDTDGNITEHDGLVYEPSTNPIIGTWEIVHIEDPEQYLIMTFTDTGSVSFAQNTMQSSPGEDPVYELITIYGTYILESTLLTLTWTEPVDYAGTTSHEYTIVDETLTISGLFHDEDEQGNITPVDITLTKQN
jgi:uncharacterized repeat protein (TIGR02543 family)